jgi:Tol biopolymer transport system component
MGEVYRARDARLGREVALKVLPEDLSSNADRLRRFEKEARAASSLNHPNIVTVYDIGSSDSTSYIAMELVDGKTLRDLLEQGPFSVRRLLQTGVQVADGLGKAHASGIVHRDLKPENVMVTGDGLVKILDFGLAKLTEPSQEEGQPTQAPTVSQGTTPGVVMGTVAYMSPEQASALAADFHSDQFSFGSMLYEMATGKQAFRRATAAQTMAAIIQEEPEPVASTNPKIPAPLRWVIEQCLAKEPKRRYASTEDLARDLARIRDHISEVSGLGEALAMPGRKKRSFWAFAAVGAAALLLAVLAALYLRRPLRPSAPIRASLILPEKTRQFGSLALSPDGKRLAFTAASSPDRYVLWIRTLDEATAKPITVRGDPVFPFWSPDSRYVAFFSDGKLRRVDSGGGALQTICDTEPVGAGGTWGPDGTIVFAPGMTSPLYRVAATGGQPVALTKLDASRHETSHRHPSFLPDGRHLLYRATGFGAPEADAIRVASLDGKLDKALVQTASNSSYARGHLLYVREGALLAQAFDPIRLEIAGPPVPIASHVRDALAGAHPFSVAERLLVFAEAVFRPSTLLWVDRLGTLNGSLGEPGLFGYPRLSPDGRRVAVDVQDPSRDTADIWIYDVATGGRSKFGALLGGMFSPPVWSPEGDRIVFVSDRKARGLFVRRIDRADEELLLESVDEISPEDWSADGRFVSLMTMPRKGKRTVQLWILPLTGERKAFPFATEANNQEDSHFSPDDRWIAYESDESGTFEIYVRSFPGPGGKWQVSTAGGSSPRWGRDGKELFYLSLDRKLMTVPVHLAHGFQAGPPRTLFPVQPILDIAAYDVTPDGRRFLVKSPSGEESPPNLTLVTDWTALLKDR